MITPFKFVTWDVPSIEEIMSSTLLGKIATKINNNAVLTDSEKEQIVKSANGYNDCKILGWQFDFRPVLKIFWVKTQYYGIQEIYAHNKTAARKYCKFMGKVYKIVEVN